MTDTTCCGWHDKIVQSVVTDLTKALRMFWLYKSVQGVVTNMASVQDVVSDMTRVFRMLWVTWQECSECCGWPCCWRYHVAPWSPSCLATDWQQQAGTVSPRSSSLPPPHPHLHPCPGPRRRRSPAEVLNTHKQLDHGQEVWKGVLDWDIPKPLSHHTSSLQFWHTIVIWAGITCKQTTEKLYNQVWKVHHFPCWWFQWQNVSKTQRPS